MSLPELSQDINLYKWFLAFLGLIVTAFALKMVISFDFNKYLERRDNKKKERLRLLCPHADAEFVEGEPVVKSTMVSPSGTLRWVCQRCGSSTDDPGLVKDIVEAYAKDPKMFLENSKKFHKYLEKYYGI